VSNDKFDQAGKLLGLIYAQVIKGGLMGIGGRERMYNQYITETHCCQWIEFAGRIWYNVFSKWIKSRSV